MDAEERLVRHEAAPCPTRLSNLGCGVCFIVVSLIIVQPHLYQSSEVGGIHTMVWEPKTKYKPTNKVSVRVALWACSRSHKEVSRR